MNNKRELADLIKGYLDEIQTEIPPDEFGWIERNNSADVYHNIFSRVFLDVQNLYEEIRDAYREQDIQNGYDLKFEIKEIRGSKVWTRRLYLRGVWCDFLQNASVGVTISLDYSNLNQRTVVIMVAGADIFQLFKYQKNKAGKCLLADQGLFDVSKLSKPDRDGFLELYV